MNFLEYMIEGTGHNYNKLKKVFNGTGEIMKSSITMANKGQELEQSGFGTNTSMPQTNNAYNADLIGQQANTTATVIIKKNPPEVASVPSVVYSSGGTEDISSNEYAAKVPENENTSVKVYIPFGNVSGATWVMGKNIEDLFRSRWSGWNSGEKNLWGKVWDGLGAVGDYQEVNQLTAYPEAKDFFSNPYERDMEEEARRKNTEQTINFVGYVQDQKVPAVGSYQPFNQVTAYPEAKGFFSNPYEGDMEEEARKKNTEQTMNFVRYLQAQKVPSVGSYQYLNQVTAYPEEEGFFKSYNRDLEVESTNEIAQGIYPRAQEFSDYLYPRAREIKNQWDSTFGNKLPEYQYYQKEDGGRYYAEHRNGKSVEISEENIPVDTVYSVLYTDGGVDEEGRPITRQVIKRADGTFQDIIWRKPSIANSIALDGIPYTSLGANILSRDSVIAHDMEGNMILGQDTTPIFRYPNQKEKHLKNIYDSPETIVNGMIESARNLREMAAPYDKSTDFMVNMDGTTDSLLSLMRLWQDMYLRYKEEKKEKP